MIDTDDDSKTEAAEPQPDADEGLSLSEFTRYLQEVEEQPAWRSRADREMEYVDGNQLDSEILQKMQQIGMPPAVEPLIGPAIDSVLGYEAKTRTDWRVTADAEQGADESAAAMNYKLNQAERQSKADKACSDAFKPQLCVGLGWVEVSRETDPFKPPYRCKSVHRNEIWWDMLSVEPDLSDARYLLRRRWTDADLAKKKFPEQADLIEMAMGRYSDQFLGSDGGTSTNLAKAWDDQRGWSIEEQNWRDISNRRVCLFECWYRRWVDIVVIRLLDGRVVEYDPANPVHTVAIAAGVGKPARHVVARMFVSYWVGPHKLYDGPTPYRHHHFPYVPFWGSREDRTGVPYGVVRGMIYLQDNVNSAVSKIRWGLSAVRTERTKGAVAMSDEKFRQQISRVDADIILDDAHMAKQGARFEVHRDFQLTEQQYRMLQDARLGIERCSRITAGFQGQRGTATSGLQENTQVEQSTQALADLMDNFRFARTQVGELLLSMIIEDMIGKPERVVIRGQAPIPDRVVMLNEPMVDEATGLEYRNNDVERIRMKVSLSDVPSTPGFRAQQLSAMSEAFKAMPQDVQVVVLPHLLSLMDVPHKDEIIKAIVEARSTLTEDQVQERIDAAVRQALKDAQYDLRSRELDAKYGPERMAAELAKIAAQIKVLDADAGKKFMELMFAGMQAGEVVAAVPQVAPVADALITRAASGNVAGQATPAPTEPAAGIIVKPVGNPKTGMGFKPRGGAGPAPGLPGAAPGDTSPNTPAQPASPFVGREQGIETMRADSTGPQR